MNPSALSQPEKEALLDLLLAATYGDGHLSLSENEIVRSTYDSLEWDSSTSYDIHYAESSAAVRKAFESEAGIEAYVSERCGAFQSAAAKELAIGHLAEVLDVDGKGEGETGVYEAAKNALGL